MPEKPLNLEQNSDNDPPGNIYDVAVVGAGPVGLATAIGLLKRGIKNIIVFDQTRGFRKVGQGLDLLPNGLKALKYIDVEAYEAVKKTAFNFLNPTQSNGQWLYKNLQGETIRSIPLSFEHWFNNYGEGRVSISWYDLQTTLRHLLPEATVKVNHRCINLVDRSHEGYIQLDFVSDLGSASNPYAHWQYEKAQGEKAQGEKIPQDSQTVSPQVASQSIKAKLVVAADGINSTIRRVLYKDSQYAPFAQPEYSGFAAIGCRGISAVSQEIISEIEEKFLNNSVIVSICNDRTSSDFPYMEYPRMMLFRRGSSELGYILHAAWSLDSLKERSGNALIELGVETVKKAEFPSCLQKLVFLSPAENMIQRPYYIHRARISEDLKFPQTTQANFAEIGKIEPPWNVGRSVMVGDAAHGMPPFRAQGTNQGFEDAAAIASAIAQIAQQNHWDNIDAIGAAFQKYERLRRPIMASIQQATMTGVSWSETERKEYDRIVYCRNIEQILATF